MRASELLDRRVVDAGGRTVGVVVDLVCDLDDAAHPDPRRLRVDRLLLSTRRAGSLFGYGRRAQRGPWLLAALVTRLHGRMWTVPWSDVAETGEVIRLR